jgi:hypothetical protein
MTPKPHRAAVHVGKRRPDVYRKLLHICHYENSTYRAGPRVGRLTGYAGITTQSTVGRTIDLPPLSGAHAGIA